MASDEEVRRLRLRAQRLEPRVRGSAAEVVRAVCGIQAQDARAAALSVRARSIGLTAAEVERERVEDRSFVRTWAWRGTLHLVAAEDLGWVLPLVAPGAMRSVRARWAQLGLDENAYGQAREAMAAELARGPLTRAQLVERLARHGLDASGRRGPHLIRFAALEGLICQGPGETYVRLEDWIGPLAPVPREAALAELGRRYLAAYSPADASDLAAWSGLPAAECRAAWPAAAAEAAAPPAGPPVVRLLGGFDTYLLGYRTRELAVAREHARRVWPGGGWLHPVALVDGRAAGTWRFVRGSVDVEPFAPLDERVRAALREEEADVARFLGA